MQIFIFWVVLIAIILGIYLWHTYRRSPKGFRFQVKLTIIFILLVLLPSVPLTFLVSDLLTRGVEMFLLPGVENSMSQSLEIIKSQLEEKGTIFLRTFPSKNKIDQDILTINQICYLGKLNCKNRQNAFVHSFMDNPEILAQSPLHNQEHVRSILGEQLKSSVYAFGTNTICEVYQFSADSSIDVVAFAVDPKIVQAKDQVSQSLRVYTFLSLMKKSVVEGQIIWGLSTIFIIILTMSAIYAAKLLSRGISEPIGELVKGMQRVAEGDLSQPVEVRAKDEIKFLISSFNQMSHDLKVSQEKLVKAERLAAWQDVARKVSHEIKNALTPIQLSLRRLISRLEPDDQSEIDEPLTTIQEEVESLRRLAEEFTTFSRLPQTNLKPENLNDLIRKVTTLIEAEPHSIALKLELDESIPPILLDREQMRRALHNIIKNSIEASERGSAIFIQTKRVEKENRTFQIIIRDQGAGMSPEVLAKIFEPYFTTKNRGMGLGLSIVKRIIEDHNGEIVFESASGKGTQVTIYL